MKNPTLEEAKQVLKDFPEEDDYVSHFFSQFMSYGEYDDNTCETSNYWNKCKKVVDFSKKRICPACGGSGRYMYKEDEEEGCLQCGGSGTIIYNHK